MRFTVIPFVLLMSSPWVSAQENPFAFPEPDREAKPWTRWWWLGSAVDAPNLTRSLEEFRDAGLGGVEITPIYGVKGAEERNIEYLSDPWLAMLAHTTDEAARLGLGVDMPTGTGWPFGGPTVALNEADMKVTIRKVDIAKAGDALGLPEDGVFLTLMAYGGDGPAVDVSGQVKDGVVSGPLPEGAPAYYVVFYRHSGRMVKRPAPGGAGYSVNTYSHEAMSAYLNHFTETMADYDGQRLRAWFHDSFEYSGDWTPDLWDAFEAQHGYDLRQYLPAMTGNGDADTVARIKTDYRDTLAQLLLKEFTRQWTGWAYEQGAMTRNQAHGSPGNLLDLYAAVDIPETEIFGPSGFEIPGLRNDPNFDNEPPDLLMLKFASSAAHLTGKKLVSSETCTWLGEHFQVSLAQCKPEIDQLLAAGINHIFYHGTPYSPDDAAWPGWLFYASVHFGPTNPWWDDFQYLNGYIARCQALLQAAQPANDVLLYFPLHEIWHDREGLMKQLTVHNIDDWLIGSPFYETAEWLTEKGYAFDYVSDALLEQARVTGSAVALGAGNYTAIVIPEMALIPHGTLEQLMKLAEAGARVVFQGEIPGDVPGFARLDERRARLSALMATLDSTRQGQGDSDSLSMGKGRIDAGEALDTVLPEAGIIPESLATSGLSMIRKRHDEGWLYFVANLTPEPVDDFWPLATPAKSVVLLDPLWERSGLAETEVHADATAVRIALRPGESCFLRTYADREIAGPAWPYWKPAGTPVAIDGTWDVTFLNGGPEIPASYSTKELSSWTSAPDEESKRFAGTARSRITFDAPAAKADAWRLDLGKVCESARVTLNGEFLGCSWSLPHTLTIEQPLKADGNALEIDVTNLAANRIADMDRRDVDWKIFEDINLVNIQYKPFDASDWPLFHSGLLGPVTLAPLVR